VTDDYVSPETPELPGGRWRDEDPLGAGSGKDRRERWDSRTVNHPARLRSLVEQLLRERREEELLERQREGSP
jgi:hypothetical protein